MINDPYLCFLVDLAPRYHRGYPLSHLLAAKLKGPGEKGGETLELFFTSEIIKIQGQNLAKLLKALLAGTASRDILGKSGWLVNAVSRRYYGG